MILSINALVVSTSNSFDSPIREGFQYSDKGRKKADI